MEARRLLGAAPRVGAQGLANAGLDGGSARAAAGRKLAAGNPGVGAPGRRESAAGRAGWAAAAALALLVSIPLTGRRPRLLSRIPLNSGRDLPYPSRYAVPICAPWLRQTTIAAGSFTFEANGSARFWARPNGRRACARSSGSRSAGTISGSCGACATCYDGINAVLTAGLPVRAPPIRGVKYMAWSPPLGTVPLLASGSEVGGLKPRRVSITSSSKPRARLLSTDTPAVI